MVKTKSTPCGICGKKYKGAKGIRIHQRIDHKVVVDFFKEAELSSIKFRSESFTKKYEKSLIPIEERWKTMAIISPVQNQHFHKLLAKYELKGVRTLPSKHPIFKTWKFKSDPWGRVVDVLYEAIGYWACENYHAFVKWGDIKRNTSINEVVDKMLSPHEIAGLIDYYHGRGCLWGHDWSNSTINRIGNFIRYLSKTSHIRILIGLKLIEGDGEYCLGEPMRYGPVDIHQHLSEYMKKK